MRPLPSPSQARVLLSFDFDGTLHDPAQEPPVPIDFFEQIRSLRENHGALWGINTGRSMPQMLDGFLESSFPFLPDWVIARERELYFPNHFGRWLPDSKWNARCEREIQRLFKKSRKLLARVRQEVEVHTGAQWIEMAGEPAGIISRTEEEMEWIVRHLLSLVREHPAFSWQRNSIYLRFGHRDFQKGSTLSHLANTFYQIPCAQCFAMGDSHNDLEMLSPAHSGMAACPANAVPAIQEMILQRGGFVASKHAGQAAVEALKHYFN